MVKRLRRFKQRQMHRRMITGRKPMSPEDKELRKKNAEIQRIANKEKLAL
jgi:hypothetical protein